MPWLSKLTLEFWIVSDLHEEIAFKAPSKEPALQTKHLFEVRLRVSAEILFLGPHLSIRHDWPANKAIVIDRTGKFLCNCLIVDHLTDVHRKTNVLGFPQG